MALYRLLSLATLVGAAGRGRGVLSGDELRLAWIGRAKIIAPVLDSVLDSWSELQRAPRAWTWDPPEAPRDADLVLVEVHRWRAGRFRRAGWHVLPLYARLVGDPRTMPPPRPSRSLRSDLLRARSGAFTLDEGGSPREWRDFRDGMVLPHAIRRFADRAHVPSAALWRELERRGRLLFVCSHGSRVAGACVVPTGPTSAWVPVLGARGGDPELLRAGAVSALYDLVIAWARESGIRRLDLGRTRIFAKDPLLHYKLKWGFRVTADPLAPLVAWRPGSGDPALGSALTRRAAVVTPPPSRPESGSSSSEREVRVAPPAAEMDASGGQPAGGLADPGAVTRWIEDALTLPSDARRGWREVGWRGIWTALRVRTLDRVFRRGRLIVFEQRLDRVPESGPPPGVRIEELPHEDVALLAGLVRPTSLRRFRRALAVGRICLVARRGDRPVGYTWISTTIDPAIETYAFPLPADAAYLWDLYVVPEERNSGIGTALVSARLRRARELGFRRGWRAIAPKNRPSLRVLEKTAGGDAVRVGEIRYVKRLRRMRSSFHPAPDEVAAAAS